jgi:hypothetical protein
MAQSAPAVFKIPTKSPQPARSKPVGRGAQVPHQFVGRGDDVHRGAAPGPAPQDLSAAKRPAEPRGLGLQIRRAVSLSVGASSSTLNTPSVAARSEPGSSRSPAVTSAPAPASARAARLAGFLVRARTRHPAVSSRAAAAPPWLPVAPVTKMICALPPDASLL